MYDKFLVLTVSYFYGTDYLKFTLPLIRYHVYFLHY